MKKIIKLGILACSHVADKTIPTLKQLECLDLYAIASRSKEKATEYADRYSISKRYYCYEDLLKDPEIDLVYITTPHSHHLQYIKMCAEAKKNIICEKAFTLNTEEAREAFDICKKNNVFITEAIWVRFTPMADKLKEIIEKGTIGKVYALSCNLGYNNFHRERYHDINLGGGALLDLGVYCLNFFDIVTGGSGIKSIKVNANFDSQYKVDRSESVLINYENGIKGNFFCTVEGCSDRMGFIYGDNGFIVIDNINVIERIRVYYDNKNPFESEILPTKMISGYEYEFIESCDCINNGKKETLHAPYSQTMRIMNQLDLIRKEMGFVFPMEQ